MKIISIVFGLLLSAQTAYGETQAFCVPSGQELKPENALFKINLNGGLMNNPIGMFGIENIFDQSVFKEGEIFTFDWGGSFYLKKIIFKSHVSPSENEIFYVAKSAVHALKFPRQLVDCTDVPGDIVFD